MRLETANRLNLLAVISTQFEMVNLIKEEFLPTGIWIRAVDAYSLPVQEQEAFPARHNWIEMEQMR